MRLGSGLAERSAELAKTRAQLEAVPEIDERSVWRRSRRRRPRLERPGPPRQGPRPSAPTESALLEQALERLERAADADPSQPCPTCGRPLGNDFVAYVKHCKAEAADAKKAAAAAATAKRDLADRVRAEGTGRCGRGRASTRAGRSAVAARRAGRWPLGRDRGAAEPFDGAVPELDELRASAERARALATRAAELGAQRQHLAQAERDLAAARRASTPRRRAREAGEAEGLAFDDAHTRGSTTSESTRRRAGGGALGGARASDALKDAEKAEAELLAALRQAKETQAKVDELRSEARYVERVAMLLEGFRNHLVARVGPELSREAEALFRELTNHEYDDLKVDEEKLTIQIADGDSYFAIDRFSGSETDLANLALRVAISTQLSRLSGADVGMMVLDEVLASLDEERKDLMVQALGRLVAVPSAVRGHARRADQGPVPRIDPRAEGRRRRAPRFWCNG